MEILSPPKQGRGLKCTNLLPVLSGEKYAKNTLYPDNHSSTMDSLLAYELMTVKASNFYVFWPTESYCSGNTKSGYRDINSEEEKISNTAIINSI